MNTKVLHEPCCCPSHREHWVESLFEFARLRNAEGEPYTTLIKRWECTQCGRSWLTEQTLEDTVREVYPELRETA
jgi:hypothetical protein